MNRGKILIGGDSWGRGEWSSKYRGQRGQESLYHVSHQGLEFYLDEAGYTVTNASLAGQSNTVTVESLQRSLDSTYNYVFWFKSDPLRCLRPYDATVFNKDVTVEKLQDICKEQSRVTYDFLNKLDKKIYCIGGCFALYDFINEYENLIPVIPSVIKLCYPDFILPDLWFSDWIDLIDKHYVDLERFTAVKRVQDSLALPDRAEYFWPDGRHANRKAHKLIFDVLDKQLGLTQ